MPHYTSSLFISPLNHLLGQTLMLKYATYSSVLINWTKRRKTATDCDEFTSTVYCEMANYCTFDHFKCFNSFIHLMSIEF